MFELYDINTNELVKVGTLRQLSEFVGRASSTIRKAYIEGYTVAEKYHVVCNGKYTYNACALYDVYDLEDGNKKIISKCRAKDIASQLYMSVNQVYLSANKNKPVCHNQYLVKFVVSGRGGKA